MRTHGKLSNLTYKKGINAFTKYDYLRDNVGNVTEAKETKSGSSAVYDDYTYDAINEVTMDSAPSHTWNYTYDSVGNMATSVADGTTTNYTYNTANRLTAKGTRTFTYDNQLKTYNNGSTVTTYSYDASGNRTDKTQTGTGATNYQYVNAGNNQVMVTKNLTAGTSSFNLYGNDLISQGDAATTARQYYLTDGLGNVRYPTNSSGTTLNSYGFDPYGSNQTTSGTTANNYAYQAEQKDSESSLVYLRARYYDPTIGRFTSIDPLSGNMGDSLTQNGYNYTNNNPINLYDPMGLSAWSTFQGFTGLNKLQSSIANNCSWGSILGNGTVATAKLAILGVDTVAAGTASAGLLFGSGAVTETGAVTVGAYTLTQTVASKIAQVVGQGPNAGLLSRPYLSSPLTIQNIISSGGGIPDQTISGATKFIVPGSLRGSQGSYELVVDQTKNIIYHFLFKGTN